MGENEEKNKGINWDKWRKLGKGQEDPKVVEQLKDSQEEWALKAYIIKCGIMAIMSKIAKIMILTAVPVELARELLQALLAGNL